MSAVYREARDGHRPVGDGARLVYMLTAIGRVLTESEFETRLESLEQRLATLEQRRRSA
jgi:hypothetical protein